VQHPPVILSQMYYTPYNGSKYRAAGYALTGGSTLFGSAPKVSQGMAGSRSRTYTTTKRKQKNSRSYTLTRAIRGTQPAKHVPFSDITISSGLHNNIYTWCPTQNIARGTNNDQRNGDAVFLEAMKLNFYAASNALITKAVEVRILVCYSGEEYSCPVTFISSGLQGAELFVTSASNGWMPNSMVNPKAVTVLDDRTIILNNSISAVSDLESLSYTIPLKAKFPYQSAGSVYGKTRNLYVVVMGSILDGVTNSTLAYSMNVSGDLIFK